MRKIICAIGVLAFITICPAKDVRVLFVGVDTARGDSEIMGLLPSNMGDLERKISERIRHSLPREYRVLSASDVRTVLRGKGREGAEATEIIRASVRAARLMELGKNVMNADYVVYAHLSNLRGLHLKFEIRDIRKGRETIVASGSVMGSDWMNEVWPRIDAEIDAICRRFIDHDKHDERVKDEKKAAAQKRSEEARWISFGAGTGIIPAKDSESFTYSGAITGTGGGYVSGRFGKTWGLSSHTWGVGLMLGGGTGSRGTRVGGGINLYPIDNFYLQLSGGTATYSYKTPRVYANGGWTSAKTITESGVSVMGGYDFHIGKYILLSIAGGTTKIITEDAKGEMPDDQIKDWLPAYSVSIGYKLGY